MGGVYTYKLFFSTYENCSLKLNLTFLYFSDMRVDLKMANITYVTYLNMDMNHATILILVSLCECNSSVSDCVCV